MSKPNLSVMEIYPEMLQDAYELCERILTEDYGYTTQQFFKQFDNELKYMGLGNLSNMLVRIMFDITKYMIKAKDIKADVDYYINGSLDTHFYINGEQQ